MTISTYQSSRLCKHDIPWQTPVVTERLAAEQLVNKGKYLPIPWATIIDWYHHGTSQKRQIAAAEINHLESCSFPQSYTVCQHYKFKFIIPLLKKMGCTDLYAPHSTETQTDGLRTHAFPLFAPVVPNVIDKRELLYSFVGTHMSHYISTIREQIFNDTHPTNTVIVPRGKWQFNAEVYNEQVTDRSTPVFDTYLANQNKQYYKRVLQSSRYSLCPSGAGPTSIRIYESLACGAIPIILADTFRFPRVKGVDWNECVVNIQEDNYKNMRDILKTIDRDKEEEMRHNCIRAYTQVSGENFVKCIQDYYE